MAKDKHDPEDKKRTGSTTWPEHQEKTQRRQDKQFKGKKQADGSVQFDKVDESHKWES